ncbi:hypothetical protein GCM10011584_18530 [Nocardioides phosphati]|uniref:DUF3105 domain-containing protein n=1 Tax=Nocardioides phosphati TaxID=1867775 RepID=A0ABQ2NET4_9ACTN|nr:hypothetical protein GCM10011584_18530 [Nocardioides phosphati]
MSTVSARVKVLLAVLGLVVVVAIAPFAYGAVTKHLKLGLEAGEDPYAGVTIVHRQLPPSTVPDEWAHRLEKQAGTDLGLTVRQDWRPGRGDGPWLRATAFQRRLAQAVNLPAPRDYRVMGVVTNAEDPAAVAAHGALFVLWFQTPVDADTWIRSHPKVFTDPGLEKARTTWWAGFDVVSYAPPASGTDLTDKVDHWVRSITACPNGEQGCSIPAHIATAGAKP